MPHYPQSGADFESIAYPVGPGATPLQVDAAGIVNTKGSFTELVASTPFAANILHVVVTRTSANTGLTYYLDIATGAAGSETVIIPDLITEACNSFSSFGGSGLYILPVAIPSGTRISARCQANATPVSIFVGIELIRAGTTPGISSFVTYGLTSTTKGTQIDPGGTANTKGSYQEITPATSAEGNLLLIHCTLRGNGAPTSCTWAIDIATGSAGSETVLIPDIRFSFMQTGVAAGAQMLPRSKTFLTYIPNGTRIAVRASCTTNDATDRLIDVAITLGEAPAEPGGGGETSFAFVG